MGTAHPSLFIDGEQTLVYVDVLNSHYNANRGKAYTYLKQLNDKK